MRKVVLSLLIFCSALFCLKGQSTVGSHIGYRQLNTYTYEVVLTLYHDCSGASIAAPRIYISDSAYTVYDSIYPTLFSTRDVTGQFWGCSTLTKCNGGNALPYGIEELVYKDTVDVSAGGCKYRFSYQSGTRPSYFTSWASTTIANEATLNKCVANTSATMASTPRFLIPTGRDFVHGNSFADQAPENDSMAFRLVCPQVAPWATNPPFYNCQKPITFLGFPNAGLGFPAGFYFDEQTGDLAFRPIVNNEIAPYCIEISEYRYVAGVAVLVGLTQLEATFFVFTDSSGNNPPKITGKSEMACVGKKTCINITTSDNDSTDSTYLNIMNSIPGATVSITRNGKYATAEVCWTPQKQHISNQPYSFRAEARDGACPLNGITSRGFSFFVRETPDSSTFEYGTKSVSCNEATVQLKFKKSLAGLTYWVQPVDSTLHWELSADTLRIAFADTGWNKFSIVLRTNTPCQSDPFIDSVYIPATSYKFQISATKDTAVCDKDSVHFYVQALNGVVPYQYKWELNTSPKQVLTQTSFSLKPTSSFTFHLSVKDSSGCVAAQNGLLKWNPLPVISAGPDQMVCPKMPVPLSGRVISGDATPFNYEWVGVDTGETVYVNLDKKTTFTLRATDQNGCRAKNDTVVYNVYAFMLNNFPDTTICYAGKINIKSTAFNYKNPLQYKWVNTANATDSIAATLVLDSLFVLKASDGNGCVLYDSIRVTVLPQIQLQTTADTNVCKGTTTALRVNGHNGVNPVTYLWDNNTTADSLVVIPQAKQTRKITVTDAYNCTGSDSIVINVLDLPVPFAGNDQTVCIGANAQIQATTGSGTPPYIYQWDNGPTTDSFSTVIQSSQTFALKTIDANGCAGYDTVTVTMFPPDTVKIAPVSPVCKNNGPIILSATPTGGVWTGAGLNNTTFNPDNAGVGNHNLTYSFTNIFGCTANNSMIITIKPLPILSFTVGIDSGIVPFKIKLTNTTPVVTYGWQWEVTDDSGSFYLTSTDENPEFMLTHARWYSVKLTAYDSVNGCMGNTVKPHYIKTLNPTTGIETIKPEYKIYPNPATNKVFIEGENILGVEMTDLQGRSIPVSFNKTGNTVTEILLPALSQGVYLLRVSNIYQTGFVYKLQVD